MATTTPNFGWDIPQSTDLVKDGATAIAALGTDIDSALVDLKGGTTGQVLSKNSNTDLDFTWVAQDDSNAIQNTIVDAKGDLITATAADVPARLASSGVNGEVLTIDTSTATGLKWALPSAGAYTELASGSLPAGTLTLSSISSAYTDLKLIILASRTGSDGDFYRMRFNNDTGNNYNGSGAYGDNPLSFSNSSMNVFGIGQDNGAANGLVIVDIPNYTNTSIWKTARTFATVNNQNTNTQIGFAYNTIFWNGTAAINRLDVFPFSGTFATGTYILYGVK